MEKSVEGLAQHALNRLRVVPALAHRLRVGGDEGQHTVELNPESHEAADDPAAEVEQGELAAVLQRALAQLPWTQRVALVLGDVEGWTYREIAATTGVSIGTVKSRIFRGRIRLRQILS